MDNFTRERVERICRQINPSSFVTKQELIAAVLRETVRDFPQFRTAETPNEWEKGYHTMIRTIHDIANEMDQYAKDHRFPETTEKDWDDFWSKGSDPTWGYEWTPVNTNA